MEAYKFGFADNGPPAFKFVPSDADLVTRYLLPRALGLHNPHAHAIIEGVHPGSVPPWELIENLGDYAFFFSPPSRKRTVQSSGVWMGQKGEVKTVTLLRPGGGEVDVTYKCYHLSFGRDKTGPAIGYVMHEYTILSPPLPDVVLTRVKYRKRSENEERRHPEQPGPSHQYGAAAANGEGSAGAQDHGAPYYDGNGGGGYHYPPLQYVLPDNNNYGVPIPDHPGAAYNHSYNPLDYALPACEYDGNFGVPDPDQPSTSYNQGFTDAQTHAFYGDDGMVITDGAYYYDPSHYVPECGSESYGNEYEPWQYEQDPSNQHQAGDAAVMCAGGEAFIGEEEAGGNTDKGSVLGTNKTSAHSTIPLCDDNTLFGIGDGHDLKCEQNDAGDPIN